ncbi:hypothetical protein AAE478_005181 [Parahypoxylon ruwenzoriense]
MKAKWIVSARPGHPKYAGKQDLRNAIADFDPKNGHLRVFICKSDLTSSSPPLELAGGVYGVFRIANSDSRLVLFILPVKNQEANLEKRLVDDGKINLQMPKTLRRRLRILNDH